MTVYEDLANKVLGACFMVHSSLGSGLLESAYEGALAIEFKFQGIPVQRQKAFPVYYRKELAGTYIADLVVDNSIILELKSVSRLRFVMKSQLLNYLKISGLKTGYLVNFQNESLEWQRMVL